jgi:hypothetical protein
MGGRQRNAAPRKRALRQLGAGIEERLLLNRSGGQVGAT